MARTEQVIYDEIVAEKENQPDLEALNSGSNTAIWRLICWIVAKAIHWHELLLDAFKEEVNLLAEQVVPGNLAWYKSKCLEFQYGDDLVFVNNVPTYAVADDTKKIIKRAAVVESTELLIKVAKEAAGVLTALSADEKLAFEAYLNKIKFAGTQTTVLTLNADLLRASGNFYYNAIYPLADVKADLDARAEAFLEGIEYNGFIYANKLHDLLQATLGYHDHENIVIEATPASSISWVDIGRRYNPLAGYITLDQPLSDLLTFIPVVDVQS